MNILITGVSRGLGKNLAIMLLSQGYNVWGISTKDSSASELVDLLQYTNFKYSKCNLKYESEILEFIEQNKDEFSRLNTIIFNAGSMENDLEDGKFNFSKFKEVFDVNLISIVMLIEKSLPIFRQNNKGMFIAISSLCSYRGVVVDKVSYPASKAALNMIFESFRLQLSNDNIQFINVNFGPLGDKNSLMTISYSKAAGRIISLLNEKRNYLDYPLLPALIMKMLRFCPDKFVSYIIKFKKAKK